MNGGRWTELSAGDVWCDFPRVGALMGKDLLDCRIRSRKRKLSALGFRWQRQHFSDLEYSE